MTAVEVCLICDIAGCRHIRERKAKMTHPTDEELDALVGMLQQRDKSKHGYTGHPLYNRNGPQAADAITALRAQLAEVQAELSYANKRIEHAFERNDRQAQTIDELTARADRAEAALAAQIEADAGLIDALYRMALKDSDDDLSSPWKSHKASAYGTALQTIRNQPHDRTALDRMLRAEREKAMREAAEYVGKASNTFPDNIAWAVEDLANAILAMMEQPKDTK